jgi:hypothetical protein
MSENVPEIPSYSCRVFRKLSWAESLDCGYAIPALEKAHGEIRNLFLGSLRSIDGRTLRIPLK